MLEDMWWGCGELEAENVAAELKEFRERPLLPCPFLGEEEREPTFASICLSQLTEVLAGPYLSSQVLGGLDYRSKEGAKRILARVLDPAARSRIEAEALELAHARALDEDQPVFSVERHLPKLVGIESVVTEQSEVA